MSSTTAQPDRRKRDDRGVTVTAPGQQYGQNRFRAIAIERRNQSWKTVVRTVTAARAMAAQAHGHIAAAAPCAGGADASAR
jgi:hypothetical protein